MYTGAEIPGIGLGTFGSDAYDNTAIAEAVSGAIKLGYRYIDCAACYGNEDLIGEVFDNAVNEKTVTREELFITSKVWNDMHAKGNVLLSCAKSLELTLFSWYIYSVHI